MGLHHHRPICDHLNCHRGPKPFPLQFPSVPLQFPLLHSVSSKGRPPWPLMKIPPRPSLSLSLSPLYKRRALRPRPFRAVLAPRRPCSAPLHPHAHAVVTRSSPRGCCRPPSKLDVTGVASSGSPFPPSSRKTPAQSPASPEPLLPRQTVPPRSSPSSSPERHRRPQTAAFDLPRRCSSVCVVSSLHPVHPFLSLPRVVALLLRVRWSRPRRSLSVRDAMVA